MKRLLSTGVVTRAPDRTDHRPIGEHLPALGVREFELSFYAQWYSRLEEVQEDLRASTLAFPVMHTDKELGAHLPDAADEALARFAENCRFAATLGAGMLVLHLWELPIGDHRLDENLARLPDCLDAADAFDLTLAVETIPCTMGSPLDNVLRAVDRDPRCGIVLDTEFLAMYGELDAALELETELVAHIHVKDYDGALRDDDGRRRYLMPGEGQLDLDDFLSRFAMRGYPGYATLEISALEKDGQLDRERLLAAMDWVTSRAGP